MCRVEGTHYGKRVTGNSYVELTNQKEVKKANEAVETATAEKAN